jgi:hypothetical protein
MPALGGLTPTEPKRTSAPGPAPGALSMEVKIANSYFARSFNETSGNACSKKRSSQENERDAEVDH